MARVFVITGPSGVGKGTLIRGLLARIPELELSVSATTRTPRPGEVDGVDYHFLSDEEFDRKVAAGAFVEHAAYSGRRYGTLRSELERRTAAGVPVVLEIEVQGARQVRRTLPVGGAGLHRAALGAGAARAARRARDRRPGGDRAPAAGRRARAGRAAASSTTRSMNDRQEDAVAALERLVRATSRWRGGFAADRLESLLTQRKALS